MTDTIIELRDVDKAYHDGHKTIQALEHFSLSVPQGSFVSIMGPSGCGKSTVTKIIAGIEQVDAGTVFIDGQDCTQGLSQAIQQRIGYVFQWHNLTEWRTVEGNLFFPLEMMGLKKDASWAQRAEKYLNLVGLYQYRHVYPHELSGGMKQRVGIARSLMLEPDLLVFDQPFGALDAITRRLLAESFSTAMRNEGKTMLMVTSNVEEAVRYCDDVYVMTPRPGRNKTQLITGISGEERRSPDFWLQDRSLDLKRQLVQVLSEEQSEAEKEG